MKKKSSFEKVHVTINESIAEEEKYSDSQMPDFEDLENPFNTNINTNRNTYKSFYFLNPQDDPDFYMDA